MDKREETLMGLDNIRETWTCRIGTIGGVEIPQGGDAPMRQAVQAAFFQITGHHAQAIFSGWGDKFSEQQRAIIENRLPDFEKTELTRLQSENAALRAECREAADKFHVLSFYIKDKQSHNFAKQMSERMSRAALAAGGE